MAPGITGGWPEFPEKDWAELPEPAGAAAAWLYELEMQLARALINSRTEGLPVDDASIREALRLIESARARHPSPSALIHAELDFERIRAQTCLGNVLVATRDAEKLLREAVRLKEPVLEAAVHFELASLRRLRGAPAAAVAHYEKCFALTRTMTEPDPAFDAAFELHLILAKERPGKATEMLHHCDRMYPALSRRTSRTRAYENVVRKRSEPMPVATAPSGAPRRERLTSSCT